MYKSFYTRDELEAIGFCAIGVNVLISRKASLYSPDMISIGNNVRVDDFCILSGKISFGNFIHIAAGTYFYSGLAGIEVGDFANISSHCAIYAISDDYSGESMSNPMIPEEYKKSVQKKVLIGKHVIIGTGSAVLPGVTLSKGTAIGAMSLVTKDTEPFCIYVGIPARKIKERSKKMLDLESDMMLHLS